MLSTWHIVLLLVVVLLVFGTRKLPSIGSDIGAAIKGFKKSMQEGEAKENKQLVGQKDADFNTTEQSSKSEHKS